MDEDIFRFVWENFSLVCFFGMVLFLIFRIMLNLDDNLYIYFVKYRNRYSDRNLFEMIFYFLFWFKFCVFLGFVDFCENVIYR